MEEENGRKERQIENDDKTDFKTILERRILEDRNVSWVNY